jgi:hypothetical protein
MKCNGINYRRGACGRIVDKNTTYCDTHSYFTKFSGDVIDGIKNSTNDYKVCGRCKRWHNFKKARCEKCTNESKEYKETINNSNKKNKCIASCRGNKKCDHFKVNDTEFCKRHSYMCQYTKEQLDKTIECSGCHLQKYWKDIETTKTCIDCRSRTNKVRIETKENVKATITNTNKITKDDSGLHVCDKCKEKDPTRSTIGKKQRWK